MMTTTELHNAICQLWTRIGWLVGLHVRVRGCAIGDSSNLHMDEISILRDTELNFRTVRFCEVLKGSYIKYLVKHISTLQQSLD